MRMARWIKTGGVTLAEWKQARRKLILLSPVMVLVDAFCFWGLYQAIWHGKTYAGRRSSRDWSLLADDPFGFWFSVAMEVLCLALFFVMPLVALVITKG